MQFALELVCFPNQPDPDEFFYVKVPEYLKVRAGINLPSFNQPSLTLRLARSGALATVSSFESSRRALAPGFGDLENQPGLSPSPARQQPQSA